MGGEGGGEMREGIGLGWRSPLASRLGLLCCAKNLQLQQQTALADTRVALEMGGGGRMGVREGSQGGDIGRVRDNIKKVGMSDEGSRWLLTYDYVLERNEEREGGEGRGGREL